MRALFSLLDVSYRKINNENITKTRPDFKRLFFMLIFRTLVYSVADFVIVNKRTNQPTNQATNQPTNQPNERTNQRTNERTNQQTNEPTNK